MKRAIIIAFVCIMFLCFNFTTPFTASVNNSSYVNIVNQCKEYLTYLQIYTPMFFSNNDDTPDIVLDNVPYYKADEQWNDIEILRELLLSVMTEEMAQANLAYSTREIDGELYFRYREGGFSDITYDITEDNLKIVHQTNDTVRLVVEIEIEDGIYDAAEYIVLKNTESGWRVAYYGIGTEPYNEWQFGNFIFSDEYLQYRNEDLDDNLIPATDDVIYIYYILAAFSFIICAVNIAYIIRQPWLFKRKDKNLKSAMNNIIE